jgi:hypothetical protein
MPLHRCTTKGSPFSSASPVFSLKRPKGLSITAFREIMGLF